MEKYRALPFAMYDLAVYLPGGAIILVVARWAVNALLEIDLSLPQGLISGDPTDPIGLAVRAIIWLSASYLVGHLAAFVSTYAVEKLVHNNLGYPADVWLQWENDEKNDCRAIFANNIKNRPKNLVSYIILIFQLPAIIPILIVLIWKPFGFYVPKLPKGIFELVKDKYKSTKAPIEIKSGSIWDKIVEHFVSNRNELAYSRMYNYLVIYGTLRQLSLIIIIIIWISLLIDVKMASEGSVVFDLHRFLFIQCMAFSYTACVMAFAKFNRRYFEETIMALILGKEQDSSL